jgi:hypothetical protein
MRSIVDAAMHSDDITPRQDEEMSAGCRPNLILEIRGLSTEVGLHAVIVYIAIISMS